MAATGISYTTARRLLLGRRVHRLHACRFYRHRRRHRLYFTGGALNYYSFGADPFTTFNLTGGGPGNQATALLTSQPVPWSWP